MAAKEKANQLVNNIYEPLEYLNCMVSASVMWDHSKKCAMIMVAEILLAIDWHDFATPNDEIEYWQQVKKEIEKL